MNDTERWAAAFVLALAAHFFLFQPAWQHGAKAGRTGPILLVDISPTPVVAGGTTGTHIMSAHNAESEANTADERRKLYARYLKEVSDAIHARRFEFGRTDLIGVARFSFTISPDGSFRHISRVRTSGDPILDEAAELAVRTASSIVKRPVELGEDDLAVIIEVKYQYDLH